MELIGWILAAIAGIFSTGLMIGVVLTSRRAIHITQTNTTSQSNTSSGGGSGASSHAFGAIVPIIGFGALAVIALSAISATAQSGAQVTAVSSQALQTQSEIVKAMPTQAPTVVVDRPVAQAQAPSVVDVAAVAVMVANLGLGVYLVRDKVTRKRTVKRVKQPQGITHPAFTTQSTNSVRKP